MEEVFDPLKGVDFDPPKGVLGFIEDDGEIVGVAFEKDFDPAEADIEAINAYLAENCLPPLPE